MQFETTRERLLQAVTRAGRIISVRPSLPILSHLLLQVKDGQLMIFATDLELGLLTKVVGKVQEEGQLVLPARLLGDLLSNTTDTTIRLTAEGFNARLDGEHTHAVITGLEPSDFPTTPSFSRATKLVLKKSIFAEAARLVVIAPATEDTRPVLTGVFLRPEEDTLFLVATDSFRLAEKKIVLDDGRPVFPSVIIPTRTFHEVLRVLPSEEGEEVELFIDEHQCVVEVGTTQIMSRLIDGAFPNYREIIPKSFATDAVLDRSQFLNLVKAANVFSREAGSSIRVVFSPQGYLEVRSSQGQFGSIETRMTAKIEGEAIEGAFNARFLLDVLAVLTGDQVRFQLNGKSTPAVLTTLQDQSYQYVMMPLRIEG